MIDSDREETGGESGSGSGGQGGKIGFVDFLDTHADRRDDLLPESEKKRLLLIHKDVNEKNVKQQKEKLEQNKNVKDGKITLGSYRAGMGGGGSSPFKENPALQGAQFTGVDKQVIGLPTENMAVTNEEKRDELLNQNELRYRLGYQPAPKFNPKPHGPS